MKKQVSLIILLVFTYSMGLAVNYYISSEGSDFADGLSTKTPWKTIPKLNSSFQKLKPGDKVLFRRGDIFYGNICISASGTSSNPIIIGSYGNGKKPVITGFKELNGWEIEENGIFSKDFKTNSYPEIVSLDSINTPVGRWPNTGWMTIDSHYENTIILDNELSEAPNWKGADLVLRVNHWIIERNYITGHSGNTIEYQSSSGIEARDGYGYFIQNCISTLDNFGEWFYDGNKFYIYFGYDSNPDKHSVKVSDVDILINLNRRNNIVLESLDLSGANSCILKITGSKNVTVRNCDFSWSGGYAIYGAENVGTTSENLQIIGNSITNINKVGIHLEEEFPNARILNNHLENIGTIAGMSGNSVDTGIGIIIRADGSIIEKNTIKNIGYIGILFQGQSSIVRYNYINRFCYVKDDGAGIYTNFQNNQEISNNIVINGIGAPDGTVDRQRGAHGIYIDDKGSNTLISNNTVAHNATAGIYIHNAHEITICNNTSFDNRYQIYFVHDNISPNDPIRNILLRENIFFSKDPKQLTLNFVTVKDDIRYFGKSDRNFFVKLNGDELSISNQVYAWTGNITLRSVVDWKSYTGQDINSSNYPVNIIDVKPRETTNCEEKNYEVVKYEDSFAEIDMNRLRFEYNPTERNKKIYLDRPYIDLKGTKYFGIITIEPFASLILMGLYFPN